MGLDLPEIADYDRPELEKFEKPDFGSTEKPDKFKTPQVNATIQRPLLL